MLDSNKGWHAVRFKIEILDNSHEYASFLNQPDSPIHSLIANEILCPAIQRYGENGDKIYPWRFHRLFWVQKRQHHFTFRFCADTDSQISEEINKVIKSHSVYIEMNELGLLEGFDSSKKGPDGEPELWSEEINKCWPHFICGVSRAWLELIKTFEKSEKKKGTQPRNFKEMLIFYTNINDSIKDQWLTFGQHSMLHHLNAVFGYNPINLKIASGNIKTLAMHFGPLPTNMGNLPILQGIEGLMSL